MQKTPGLDKIEKHFNMPFSDVITTLHWRDKRSIKSLSDECGISRDTFQRNAKKYGLDLRKAKEACGLTKNKGKDHWAYGLTKENSEWAKNHSDRMVAKNPSQNKRAMEKRAITSAQTLKDKKLPQEIAFAKILKELNIDFEEQTPFGPYNADFFIKDLNLVIEIDSTNKWGKERRSKAAIRDDILLCEHGIETLRINKAWLPDKLRIINILKANNVIT